MSLGIAMMDPNESMAQKKNAEKRKVGRIMAIVETRRLEKNCVHCVPGALPCPMGVFPGHALASKPMSHFEHGCKYAMDGGHVMVNIFVEKRGMIFLELMSLDLKLQRRVALAEARIPDSAFRKLALVFPG
jgi:hypothetical protein